MPSPPIRIDRMLYGGTGISLTGAALPFVLPHELVEIAPTGELRILEASPDRVAPPCVHFGECGGCHYQHAAYPAQLRIKQTILQDTLTSAGLTGLPALETYAADPWHYRNRIRLRIATVAGELRFGYNRHDAGGGSPLLPIAMCPIAAPILWQTASTLLELATTQPAIKSWLNAAVEVELFTDPEQTALQLTLFTRKLPPGSFDACCTLVERAVPQLTGAGIALLHKQQSAQGRRFERTRPGPQWGANGLAYKVEGWSYWVGRGGFFQVNRYLVPALVPLVTATRRGAIAWDLYAGVGLFARALAASFAQVTAVEAAEPAAASLAAALKTPHRAVAMTTLDFLQAAVVQRERPELIVMDPPRAGIGPEVCALLTRIQAPKLVYVSCDPVTLARDLMQLTGSGYRISELHLADMFPQTFHMETVAVLQR